LAADDADNIYVADTDNFTIRKIVIATGAVTTIAGAPLGGAPGGYGYCGYRDGPGSVARFCYPNGIASDGAGSLYVTDSDNNTIRKIVVATGVVTTIAGFPDQYGGGSADGRGADARFDIPLGIAGDGAGNLYVTDGVNNTIRKIVIATGDVTTIAGMPGEKGSADGTGSNARFQGLGGIASDGAGSVYVADSYSNTVRKVVIATQEVTTLAGLAGQNGAADGTGAAVRFNDPQGIAGDGAGHLYVADYGNSSIRKVVITNADVTTIGGAGRAPIADGTGAAAHFSSPAGIASDGAGSVYVADSADCAIRKVVVTTGAVTTIAGDGWSGSADGTGAGARFNRPEGVASDGAGNLYLSDTGNNTIRRVVVASGAVTTIAGKVGEFGFVDGTGVAARFSGPTAVVSDRAGSLYVADTANSAIRKIALATGAVTTVAGA